MAQFLSLSAAVEETIRDGDAVAMEGFTHLIPFAAAHEVIRQRRRRLTLIKMTPDLIYDGYFKKEGLSITRVPYRDVVAPLTDLGEGRIQAYIGALAIEQPHIQAGRVKPIAVTNSQRAHNYPDVPTVAQAGFPDLTFDGLTGLFGPRDMPDALRERIAADITAAIADPTIITRLTATGQVVSPGRPGGFAASIEGQRASLAAIAKVLGIKPAQ